MPTPPKGYPIPPLNLTELVGIPADKLAHELALSVTTLAEATAKAGKYGLGVDLAVDKGAPGHAVYGHVAAVAAAAGQITTGYVLPVSVFEDAYGWSWKDLSSDVPGVLAIAANPYKMELCVTVDATLYPTKEHLLAALESVDKSSKHIVKSPNQPPTEGSMTKTTALKLADLHGTSNINSLWPDMLRGAFRVLDVPGVSGGGPGLTSTTLDLPYEVTVAQNLSGFVTRVPPDVVAVNTALTPVQVGCSHPDMVHLINVGRGVVESGTPSALLHNLASAVARTWWRWHLRIPRGKISDLRRYAFMWRWAATRLCRAAGYEGSIMPHVSVRVDNVGGALRVTRTDVKPPAYFQFAANQFYDVVSFACGGALKNDASGRDVCRQVLGSLATMWLHPPHAHAFSVDADKVHVPPPVLVVLFGADASDVASNVSAWKPPAVLLGKAPKFATITPVDAGAPPEPNIEEIAATIDAAAIDAAVTQTTKTGGVLAAPVPLRDATAMYQSVRGTDADSVYVVVGLCDGAAVAARIRNDYRLSIRVEGKSMTSVLKATLAALPLVPHPAGHWSLHCECGSRVVAAQTVGSILAALPGLTTPLPDLDKVVGEGV